MHITNASGAVVYQTYYSLLDNVAESMIPMKYLFTGSQKFVKFDVVDYTNNYVGCFYAEANGIADSKMCMEYRGQTIVGYRRKMGAKEYVSFYIGEAQVGQLTKSNKVVDNMDSYMLHFLNGFEDMTPILAFFTIYYDFLFHNHSGEINKTYSVKYTYSYNKNNDKYDSDFILRNFGAAEVARMEEALKVEPKVAGMSLKTFWIIFAAGWGVALLIALIVLFIIFVL